MSLYRLPISYPVRDASWLTKGTPVRHQDNGCGVVVRLPDPAAVAREPLDTLSLQVSPQRRLYRDDPPDP